MAEAANGAGAFGSDAVDAKPFELLRAVIIRTTGSVPSRRGHSFYDRVAVGTKPPK